MGYGTREGGLKAAKKNLELYGEDFYKRIGSEGGKSGHAGKGFAKDNRTFIQKLLRKPTRAQIAGARGGKISRRKAHAGL